jgi:hypothetical protein
MKIEFIDQSQDGGNNKPSTNHFIFRNQENNGEFILGEITAISYFKDDQKKTYEVRGVIWSAKSAKLDKNTAKCIFVDYIKLAHDQEFMNSVPSKENDIRSIWQEVREMYQSIRLAFPSVEIELS